MGGRIDFVEFGANLAFGLQLGSLGPPGLYEIVDQWVRINTEGMKQARPHYINRPKLIRVRGARASRGAFWAWVGRVSQATPAQIKRKDAGRGRYTPPPVTQLPPESGSLPPHSPFAPLPPSF